MKLFSGFDPKAFKIWLDLDGVMADFDKLFHELTGIPPREYEETNGEHSFWKVCEDHGEFFFALDKMHDADELFEAVKHLNPTFLTGAKSNHWAHDQKKRWVEQHYPGFDVIVTQSKSKRDHMELGKINIIIDDWDKYKHLWEERGGTWILHTSAKDSIEQLKALGVI